MVEIVARFKKENAEWRCEQEKKRRDTEIGTGYCDPGMNLSFGYFFL